MAAVAYSLSSSLVLWNPLLSLFKRIFSFIVDLLLTLLGHASGLSVGHTKNIISLNSSGDSAVTWNRLSELFHFLVLWDGVDAIESIDGSIFSTSSGAISDGVEGGLVVGLGLVVSDFLILDIIWQISAVEGMESGWWNWLYSKS